MDLLKDGKDRVLNNKDVHCSLTKHPFKGTLDTLTSHFTAI
jgi:hypothetical protein